jgi:predicted nucleic acid-binding protein
MYADGSDHPLKAPCLAVLSLVANRRVAAVTSVETIQEILHRYTLVGRRSHVRQVIDDFLTIVPDLLPVTPTDIRLLLTYIERFPPLSARDLLHVAVMTNNGLTSIISADTDFDRVPHITRVDPRNLAGVTNL